MVGVDLEGDGQWHGRCPRQAAPRRHGGRQTELMASFADVENVESDLTDRVRAILSSTTNAVLGTVRKDGSPRLSGADPYFHDGQLRLWSMPRARKGEDLRRDPRVAFHSSRGTPGGSRRRRRRGRRRRQGQRNSRRNHRSGRTVSVSRVVEVPAWLRAAGGLGPVHGRHRRAGGHLGRQWAARDRPVVDDRRA